MAWTALIAPIAGLLGTWQKNRREIADARHQANLERIRSHSSSWKDELIVILWGYPVVSAFIPPLHDNTIAAFAFMHTLPNWFIGGWIAISLAVFGVDKVAKFKK